LFWIVTLALADDCWRKPKTGLDGAEHVGASENSGHCLSSYILNKKTGIMHFTDLGFIFIRR
jgi:hypothetical protein